MAKRRRIDSERAERSASFAAELADALHELHITHRDLANALGVNFHTVNAWTRVAHPALPSSENLERLAYLLDLRRPGLGKKVTAIAAEETVALPYVGGAPRAGAATNLRVPATSFIGREQEIIHVQEMLMSARLVTLIGSGGVGKTRLALAVATQLLQEFVNGVFVLELAALSDPGNIPQAAAHALGLQITAQQAPLEAVLKHLREKTTLLVVDNCEHLLDACAQFTQRLLTDCPGLKILATSRERLRVVGELEWSVPALSLPDSKSKTRVRLMNYEATRLFLERGFIAQGSLALTDTTALSVARICRRLDGIPLAIELAAACLRDLAVEQIATQLDDRFRLLTRGSRAALPRQQTLRAAIDWSFDLLSSQERAVFARLAVFAGGWTDEAAREIANPKTQTPNAQIGISDSIGRLVDKSLVVVEERDGAMRYRMLETIREYAREKLIAQGEMEETQRQHAAFYRAYAENAAQYLRGAEQVRWFNDLEREHDNFRAALQWSLDAHQTEIALRLGIGLGQFYTVRGYRAEGERWLSVALEQAGDQESLKLYRGLAWLELGNIIRPQGRLDHARDHYEKSLVIFEELKEPRYAAQALLAVGIADSLRGNFSPAREAIEKSLVGFRQSGSQQHVAVGTRTLAEINYRTDNFEVARAMTLDSIQMFRESGDQRGLRDAVSLLGRIATTQNDYVLAQTALEEGLAINRELGNRDGIASALTNLGNILGMQGDYDGARANYEASLVIQRETGNHEGAAVALTNLCIILTGQREYAAARAYGEESLAMRRALQRPREIASALRNLVSVACAQGDYAAAQQMAEEALALSKNSEDQRGIASGLAALGEVAHFAKQESARGYYSEALTLWQQLGDKRNVANVLTDFAKLERDNNQ